MKKITCKVCEYMFDAVRSGHYIVIDGGKLYDAFDCPVCGCQVIVNERKQQCEHIGFKKGGE